MSSALNAATTHSQSRDAWLRHGSSLMAETLYRDAACCYQDALEEFPNDAHLWYCKGVALHQEKKLWEAIDCYSTALQIKIDFAEAFENLAQAQVDLLMFDDALLSIQAALALQPQKALAHARQASILVKLCHYDEAIAAATTAIHLNPNSADGYFIRSNAYRGLNLLPNSIQDLKTAMSLRPQEPNYSYNLSFDLLLSGQLEEGWRQYETRFQTEDFIKNKAAMDSPRWTGEESLQGKTLFICPEQGLGDQIQFSRYALNAIEKGAHVVMAASPVLLPFLKSLHPKIQWVSSEKTVDELPDHDFHCPLMSLPLAFKTNLNSIPTLTSWLTPSQKSVDCWQSRIDSSRQRLSVGISWSGNKKHINNHNRSMALQMLSPLLEIDVDWHIVQTDIEPTDEAQLGEWPNLFNWKSQLRDFDDTAGLINQLDLVITVDTSVAHLAASMGKPTWIMLPFAPDFRWLLNQTDSPWYSSVKLFRQPAPRAWAPVIATIRESLLMRS